MNKKPSHSEIGLALLYSDPADIADACMNVSALLEVVDDEVFLEPASTSAYCPLLVIDGC